MFEFFGVVFLGVFAGAFGLGDEDCGGGADAQGDKLFFVFAIAKDFGGDVVGVDGGVGFGGCFFHVVFGMWGYRPRVRVPLCCLWVMSACRRRA